MALPFRNPPKLLEDQNQMETCLLQGACDLSDLVHQAHPKPMNGALGCGGPPHQLPFEAKI